MDLHESDDDAGFVWSWTPTTRHKRLDDPLFDEGGDLCGMAVKQIALVTDQEEDIESRIAEFSCQMSQCGKLFCSVVDYEMHYSTVHRNVCKECRRHFPSDHLLDIHLLEWHDTMFQLLVGKQKMYQCLVQTCPEKFDSPKARKKHLVELHKYPANFRFHRTFQKKKGSTKSPPPKDTKDVAMVAESAETEMEVEPPGMRPSEGANNGAEVKKTPGSSVSTSGRRFVYNVPKTICFGQGSQRGFHRPPGGKKRGKQKHWHQQGAPLHDSKVNIEEVDMKDMKEALQT